MERLQRRRDQSFLVPRYALIFLYEARNFMPPLLRALIFSLRGMPPPPAFPTANALAIGGRSSVGCCLALNGGSGGDGWAMRSIPPSCRDDRLTAIWNVVLSGNRVRYTHATSSRKRCHCSHLPASRMWCIGDGRTCGKRQTRGHAFGYVGTTNHRERRLAS